MKILIALILSLLTTSAQPQAPLQKVFLASIKTDALKKTYKLFVELDSEGDIKNIRTENEKGKVKIYEAELLNSKIVLVKTIGIELVTLHCNNFNKKTGCALSIEYPSNLATGRFGTFHADLKREKNLWSLNSNGKSFTNLNLIARKALGLLVGIKRIETN
jgi:hypothetical protein